MAQLLLAPVSAELSREEAAAVLENRALLERCGFETEDFGGGDVLIRQIPSDVDVEDAKALLQELAGDLLAGKRSTRTACATICCTPSPANRPSRPDGRRLTKNCGGSCRRFCPATISNTARMAVPSA